MRTQGKGRRVLITGAAGPIATALARRLESRDDIEYIAGLDTEPPVGLSRTEFIRADLRSPLVTKVIESAKIDTLVHLGQRTMPKQAGGRSRMKETNVIGSMQLLAAAQKAPRLRKAVVRSTTAVYGSSHRNPSILPEDAAVAPPAGYAKDAVEIEGYARGLARRRQDVDVTVLRFANPFGPTVSTALSKYFELPVLPTVLGYDPRLQLLHEDDAVESLELAVLETHPGFFNVGGPGAMYLSQAIRLAGKPTVPVAKPLMPWIAGTLRKAGVIDFERDQLQFLLYGRVGDIGRLRDRFGFTPRYTTKETFEDFLRTGTVDPLLSSELVERAEQWALHALTSQGVRPR